MIDFHIYCQLHQLKEQGLSCNQICQKLNLNKRTVRKWLKISSYQPKQITVKASVLDPFKKTVTAWIEKHPYSAMQIFQKLKELGFIGSYSTVQRYVEKIRPRHNKAYLTLCFAPGECAQVDWGFYKTVRVGKTRRKLSFFVMVLCYSRMIYVEFTLSQSTEFLLSAHQNAFDYFKGVPEKIMVDNMKTAVLSHPYGEVAVFNKRYLDFAYHYGFKPVACGVRQPHEKGMAENGIGYTKGNFLNGLDIPHFYALKPLADKWMNEIANQRIHGETKTKPAHLFEKERPFLKKVNQNPYDIGVEKNVVSNSRFRVIFEGNRYSIPYRLASKKLIMKVYPEKLLFYYENEFIATHVRCFDKGQNFELKDHVKGLIDQRKKSRDQKTLSRFLSLMPQAHEYYEKLKEKRFNPLHHLRKICALCDIYGEDKVIQALCDGLYFEAYSSDYVANILEQREKRLAPPGELHVTRGEDLLDLDLPNPSLDIYENNELKENDNDEHE